VIQVTIEYINQRFPPPPFDEEVENIHYFRALYDGEHEAIFPRAQQLAETTIQKPIYIRSGGRYKRSLNLSKRKHKTLASQYVVVNFSCVIAELPADLINRSLGNISADTETETTLLEFIENAVKKSKVSKTIWAAVVQHQVDGGVAYRFRRNDNKETWFEFKPGDMYFSHEDDMGADIAWIEEKKDDKKYLRVERQRLEDGLKVEQLVFLIEGDQVKEQMDITDYAREYNLTIPEPVHLKDVDELMSGYTPNEETLLNPRGRSALRNIDSIQEEINWTVTRDSIVFEKHGKPKLAIPKALWDTVAQQNQRNYGERFVRNVDLEVVSYDENKGAVPLYITWDAKTEQSFDHVKRLIRYMMTTSKTSLQAVGLEDKGGNTSAVAILYEWIQSVIKAEAIKEKFDSMLKEAIRKCIILQNAMGESDFEVKDPVIEWGDMIPKADSERDTEEADKYDKGVQSLETTIRRIHPDWSEEAILDEIKKIQEENTVDSFNPTFSQPPRVSLGNE
jgi:hypothetical protein